MTEVEYTLSSLPQDVQDVLLTQRVVKDNKEYYDNKMFKGSKKESSIFDLLSNDEDVSADVEYDTVKVIWESPVRDDKDDEETIAENDLSTILPRYKKTKEEQKKRVKSKAEVFTPTWVVNKQNNLIDDSILGEGFFNVESGDAREWEPTASPLTFTDDYPWWKYVADRRLEMCCGEGPYLFSRYDASLGTAIELRNDKGNFQRVGILDRKLRVVSEVAESASEWNLASLAALKSTYGFEWQGDNLLLSRLNFINTYLDYENDFYETKKLKKPTKKQHEKKLLEVSEISSWQLWQMDGLKMVLPDTCSEECVACKKKLSSGHDGQLSVLKWGNKVKAFNDFLPENAKYSKKK